MTEAALLGSGERFVDMLPGQWAFGSLTTVLYDTGSARLFIDTFDGMNKDVTQKQVTNLPAVARVAAGTEQGIVSGFVAHLGYERHLVYRRADVGCRYGTDGADFAERCEQNGAEWLSGVVLREFGELHYYGNPVLAEPTAAFTRELQTFVSNFDDDETSQTVPMFKLPDRDSKPAPTFEAVTETDVRMAVRLGAGRMLRSALGALHLPE